MSKEQQNTQNAQEQYAEAIAAELIAHLKSGTAPWQKPWEPTMSGLPYNHLTGNTYSGSNTLKLMMQPYDDPRWLTYKQAQSVGAQVRKGEKGVPLIRLVTHVEQTVKDENGKPVLDDKGEPQKEFVKLDFPYIRTFSVFNAEQIDGLPEWHPLHSPQHEWENHQRAEALLSASGAEIRHRHGDSAYYRPSEDHIVLPHKEQFPNAGLYYATALHELGHWTGHESRLNRELSGGFGTLSYAREELRAEIASMMLTRQLGLPHDPGRHAAYIGSWIQILTDEPTEILKAARDADKIQSYVVGFEKEIGHEPKKAPTAPSEKTPENTAAPATPSEHVSAAGRVETSEPHYSEKIIGRLAESHGWHKEDGKTASKTIEGAGGGMLNPEAVRDARRAIINALEDKYQAARDAYVKQTVLLPPAQKSRRNLLESQMEALIKGLPEQTQMQARINFYTSRVGERLRQVQKPDPPGQSEIAFER